MKNAVLDLNVCVWVFCFFLCGCVPGYELPGDYPEPDIAATLSIQELKALHSYAGRFDEITNDDVISGVVVADDKSGNFYKTIVIQDTSGGIALVINGLNLHNDYPIGRRLFVKLKGLLLFDYRGLMQLGAGIDQSDPSSLMLAGIPASLCSRYIIKGSLNNTVAPAVVLPEVLTKHMQNRYQNMLVQLEHMQLDVGDTATAYAGTAALQSRNVPIRNCSGDSVLLRNSAYASFAASRMPSGNGIACGIFTVFGSALQLMIRAPSDLQLTGERCFSPGEEEDEPAYEGGIALGGASPYGIDFDDLSSGLSSGVTVRTGATVSDSGNIGVLSLARVSWNSSGGGFKNLASTAVLPATSSAALQMAATDRALGVRQVTATDKGVAFVFLINNTLGKKNIGIKGLLQSCDGAVSRISSWTVDYAIGRKPSVFTSLPVAPGVLQTGGGKFSSTAFSAVLPSLADNSSSRVWIRIVTLLATSGSGSRPMSALDDVQISWE